MNLLKIFKRATARRGHYSGVDIVRRLDFRPAARAFQAINVEIALMKLKERHLAVLEAWNTQKMRWLFIASVGFERVSKGPWPDFLKLILLLLAVKCILTSQRLLKLENERLKVDILALQSQAFGSRIKKLAIDGGNIGDQLSGSGNGGFNAVERRNGSVDQGCGGGHGGGSLPLRSLEDSNERRGRP